MGDDGKKPATPESLAELEKEHRVLMAALLKKFNVLDTLAERLDRIENTQKQMVLHAQGPELLQQRKEGPLGNTRFHKLDFPTFDGTGGPLPFLNRCEHYLCSQRTLEEEQVWLAALHLHGSAQQWYMRLERDEGIPAFLHPPRHALRAAHQIQSPRGIGGMPVLGLRRRLLGSLPGASHPRRSSHGGTTSPAVHRGVRRTSQHRCAAPRAPISGVGHELRPFLRTQRTVGSTTGALLMCDGTTGSARASLSWRWRTSMSRIHHRTTTRRHHRSRCTRLPVSAPATRCRWSCNLATSP